MEQIQKNTGYNFKKENLESERGKSYINRAVPVSVVLLVIGYNNWQEKEALMNEYGRIGSWKDAYMYYFWRHIKCFVPKDRNMLPFLSKKCLIHTAKCFKGSQAPAACDLATECNLEDEMRT